MRSIRKIFKSGGRVYVYLADPETGGRFLRQAEAEGFTFGDGEKPTGRAYADIMAVNADGTICYVGTNGRIAFGAGAEGITRVDFGKYAAGNENYLYEKAR